MSPKPTGSLRGNDLVLRRTFRAPIDDVWTSVTSSESTARWFGPWERAGDDKKIRIQMAFEEGKPWLDGKGEPPDPARLARKVAGPLNLEGLIYLFGVAGVGVVWFLVKRNELVGWLLTAGSAAVLAYLGWHMARRCTRAEAQRIGLAAKLGLA